MTKPLILISKCLGFDNCRYNGDTIKSEIVEKLKKHCSFSTVCPEVEIGLSVPRNPIRLEKREKEEVLIQPKSGLILSEKMFKFAQKFLDSANEPDGIILKGRSPSCGIKDVKFYSARGIEIDRKHSGVFASFVLKKYAGYPIEDEGRLLDERIREHFLTKLFAFTRFREAKESTSVRSLLKFHETNKLLFMAYNQKEMRILGNMLGNQKKFTKEELFSTYFESMKRIMERPITKGNEENVLLHAFGYVSKKMKKKEIEYFLSTLNDFRENKTFATVPIALMKSQIERFEVEYLKSQTYFRRHPENL
ncbi:MAG: DUF1722 domain-containing protein [bacterium]|nr:DUF1722 domain-containing protein [bacterium]